MGMQFQLGDAGPVQAIWGDQVLNCDDEGAVHGDATFKSADSTIPIVEDEQGTEPVDELYTGKSVEFSIPLTRIGISRIAGLIPGASGTETTGDQIVVKNPLGMSMYDRARPLILKRIVGGIPSTNPKHWLTIYKASPKFDVELKFNVADQRVFQCTFKGFPVQAVREVQNGIIMRRGYLYKIGNIT